jgi:hypothetical protein
MRNLLIAGTCSLILAFGVAGGANANNANVPNWSPLSINTNLAQPMHHYRTHGMSEGRAAFISQHPNQIFSNGSSEADHMVAPDIGSNSDSGAPNEAPMADR